MKAIMNNEYLQWMGQKLFPLYIYQRLAMIIIYEIPEGKNFISSFPLLYIVICLVCVLLIAFVYPYLQISINDNKILWGK